jgi:hypothetical protein
MMKPLITTKAAVIVGAWQLGFAAAACVLTLALPLAARAQRHLKTDLATGAAFAPDGKLWVVGLDAAKHLFVQRAESLQPLVWSAPQLLDTGEDEIAADGESRPKIAFGPNPWAVISYTMPLEKPYTGFIRMLRSTDEGRHFSTPFTVHQDRQPITHRFDSIVFDQQGVLHTVWIDKRDQTPQGSGKPYPAAAAYHNTSTDGGATFGPDTKLADHTCECCRIALAPDGRGEIHALWRHVFDGEIRDHAFASLNHANPTPITRSTYDEWNIAACPHHGPGLARATESEPDAAYHAVWFGIRGRTAAAVAAVRYARLSSSGAPLDGSLRVLPDARAEHADVAAQGAHVVVVWRSTEGSLTRLRAWVSDDGGRHFSLRELAQAQGPNDHPRLAQQGSKIVVIWRLPQEIQVHDISL